MSSESEEIGNWDEERAIATRARTVTRKRFFLASCGGLILEFMVSRFENLTVFQPVINGVGGNLVAVQASRISTALHKQAELGTLLIPPGHAHPVIFVTPIANFFGKGNDTTVPYEFLFNFNL